METKTINYLKNPLVAKGIVPEPDGYICKVWKKNTEQFPRYNSGNHT